MENTDSFINLAAVHQAGQGMVNMFFENEVLVSKSLFEMMKERAAVCNRDIILEVANILACLQNSLNRDVPGRDAEFLDDHLFSFSLSYNDKPADILCEFSPTEPAIVKLFFPSEQKTK